jgi:creatinine amidohydrolase
MKEVRMERLRPAEIVGEMRERPLVFLPVGPLEWHGPHLPLGTDPLIAHGMALRVAARVGGVVLPALFIGTERERSPELLKHLGFDGDEYIVGMDFPANILKSLYYREEFFSLIVRETLDLLIQQGYRLIVILNGHGAANQLGTLDRLSAEFTARGPARVFYISAWTESDEGADSGHAGGGETSHVMALYPGLPDLSALPPVDRPLRNVDWAIVDADTFNGHPAPDFTTRDDPRAGASAERGEASLARAAAYIAGKVAAALVEMGFSPLPGE